MDCPKCGTWNPDDKQVCWRCQTPMPKPVEKKKKQPIVFLGLPVWAWIVVGGMLVVWLVAQTMGPAMLAPK
jgi:predicted nucleic acid-binding Zn ribbon protein